ncbi:hypothetical protein BKA62DRAFT_24336 [Auriculariales sp. MPI-PUGE-AT-0066]|nr:hypothetical protein BKA62DRAFT_24336 [Auriculariales sp. MPI-PUGE-AT-0066]
MVDWREPNTLLLSGRAFELIVCIAFGVYLWEFLSSLPFDWAHFSGKIKFRLPLIPYMIARYVLLLALIAGLRVINVFEPIDCQAWNHIVYATAHLCIAMASLLLVLRVVAITERNRYVMAFLGTFYLANCGMLLHGVIVAQSIYFPPLYACAALNTVASRANMWVALSFDTSCTGILMYSLLRTPGGGFWKFLVQQGVIYFLITTGCYLICVIFLMLDLNDALNELPQTIALTSMVICATRMYRDLAQYDHNSTQYYLNETSTAGTRLQFPNISTPAASRPFASSFSNSPATPSRASITIDFRKPGEPKADNYSKGYVDLEMSNVDEEKTFKNRAKLEATRSEGAISVATGPGIGTFGSCVGTFTVDNGVTASGVFPADSETCTIKSATPLYEGRRSDDTERGQPRHEEPMQPSHSDSVYSQDSSAHKSHDRRSWVSGTNANDIGVPSGKAFRMMGVSVGEKEDYMMAEAAMPGGYQVSRPASSMGFKHEAATQSFRAGSSMM